MPDKVIRFGVLDILWFDFVHWGGGSHANNWLIRFFYNGLRYNSISRDIRYIEHIFNRTGI